MALWWSTAGHRWISLGCQYGLLYLTRLAYLLKGSVASLLSQVNYKVTKLQAHFTVCMSDSSFTPSSSYKSLDLFPRIRKRQFTLSFLQGKMSYFDLPSVLELLELCRTDKGPDLVTIILLRMG